MASYNDSGQPDGRNHKVAGAFDPGFTGRDGVESATPEKPEACHELHGNDLRKQIVRAVTARPGMNQARLARLFLVSPSTIHYHLNLLQKAGEIEVLRIGRGVFSFPPSNGGIPGKWLIGALLSGASKRRVVKAVADLPDSSITEVALNIRRSPSTVKRHADMLVEAGILVKRSWKSRIHLRVHPDFQDDVQAFFEKVR